MVTMPGAACSLQDCRPPRANWPSDRFDSVSSILKTCQVVRIDPSRCCAVLMRVGVTTMILLLRTSSTIRTVMEVVLACVTGPVISITVVQTASRVHVRSEALSHARDKR
jgi:hypothetical protein